MTTPIFQTKRHPTLYIPSALASYEQEETVELRGYYWPQTQCYNVVPVTASQKQHTSFGESAHTPWPLGNILGSADEDRYPDLVKVRNLIEHHLSEAEAAPKKLLKRTKSEFEIDCPNRLGGNFILGYYKDGELKTYELSRVDGNERHTHVAPVKLEHYSLKLDLFSRNTGILESDIMLKKKALFIGCGSVGSLVAVELAKAGVGHFMLVDNDIFGYHNICRHQCGICDVGRYKTDAVEDRILAINPYAEVKKFNRPIEDVDKDEVLSFCDKDTVIVGGADNREGDLYACNLGLEAGASFVSIGCWERAFAGEIFYCLPEGTPTYKDFLAVTGYVSGRVTQNQRFYTTEADLEKASFEPGISADVNFVTIVGVKLILDLLNRGNEGYTQRILPHLTQYTLVCNTNDPKIGGEQAEIFSYPLQVTTSIIVPYANDAQDVE